jgi:RimJ/RimL family protein N-acetyltransferase
VFDVRSRLRLRTVAFRYARDSDAAIMVALRRAAELRGFLSRTGGIEAQREWLKQYEARFRRGLEHYFMICTRSSAGVGTVRVYDIQAGECEWGSWVIRDGAPPGVALESYLLINYFIFEKLQLGAARVKVRKANQAVVKFHRSMRSPPSGESGEDLMFKVRRDWYMELRSRYARYFLPALESARSGGRQA